MCLDLPLLFIGKKKGIRETRNWGEIRTFLLFTTTIYTAITPCRNARHSVILKSTVLVSPTVVLAPYTIAGIFR